ncbi:hypothetical protein Franean1_5017 [Parafrankia sp. EAN1pec]|uniref:DUF6011 domain-containing protein n=1 Tax=Parafrankia sp. (strain EAN1pec) TaxID=298653 RepID=UPI00005412E2|nr:hypothetical protein Franean1_5017 [Frankia sp. EAN1pec]
MIASQDIVRCKGCHRPLRTAATIATGFGPICARRQHLVAAGYSSGQITDAIELVELGGVIHLRGTGDRRVYLTVGSKGVVHRTAITGQCNCHAGLIGKRCHHGAAVALYATSAASRTVRVAYPMPPATYIAAA